eukprot:NODE_8910_length_635_cov_19.914062_g8285_i0.p1 GENE.NODE_8910_length_635_cov_19.914062_g8285_i0~~NODE_8910_length_635_cov_19.914062_g8285_i0.p1  ORF type:complete len:165 (-),score=30.81 NODE_8910_length_635_cov_19.914062_g8285_i0:88-582(-)
MRRATILLSTPSDAKFLTLYNIVVGKQSLKDQVPVKDASLSLIFGSNYINDVRSWYSTYSKSLPPAEASEGAKILERNLKRLQLTKYTREELTTFGLLEQGPGKVEDRAKDFLSRAAKSRLEELRVALGQEGAVGKFKEEVIREGKLANWPEQKVSAFLKESLA